MKWPILGAIAIAVFLLLWLGGLGSFVMGIGGSSTSTPAGCSVYGAPFGEKSWVPINEWVSDGKGGAIPCNGSPIYFSAPSPAQNQLPAPPPAPAAPAAPQAAPQQAAPAAQPAAPAAKPAPGTKSSTGATIGDDGIWRFCNGCNHCWNANTQTQVELGTNSCGSVDWPASKP